MSTSQAGPTESVRPRGRRPAGGDTRGTILTAARDEFAERGYDGASIRSVARRAEVDPALVRHYFQDKAELFAAGMIPAQADPAVLVAGVTAGGIDGLGGTAADHGPRALGGRRRGRAPRRVRGPELERGARRGAARVRRTGGVRRGRRGCCPVPDPALRVSLVVSQVAGVLLARNVMHLEPLASLPIPRVVELVAPTLQRYLTE